MPVYTYVVIARFALDDFPLGVYDTYEKAERAVTDLSKEEIIRLNGECLRNFDISIPMTCISIVKVLSDGIDAPTYMTYVRDTEFLEECQDFLDDDCRNEEDDFDDDDEDLDDEEDDLD